MKYANIGLAAVITPVTIAPLLTACNNEANNPKIVCASKIQVNREHNLCVKQKGKKKDVLWEVDNEDIATINKNTGKLKTKAVGNVKVTARSTSDNSIIKTKDITVIEEQEKDSLVSLYYAENGEQVEGAKYKNKNGEEYFDVNPTPEEINCPIMNIDGDFSLLTAEKNEVVMTCSYKSQSANTNKLDTDFTADVKIKLQGSSSLNYPKKSYNIKLFKSGTAGTESEKKAKCTIEFKLTKRQQIHIKG